MNEERVTPVFLNQSHYPKCFQDLIQKILETPKDCVRTAGLVKDFHNQLTSDKISLPLTTNRNSRIFLYLIPVESKRDSIALIGDFNGWTEEGFFLSEVGNTGFFFIEISQELLSKGNSYLFSIHINGKTFFRNDIFNRRVVFNEVKYAALMGQMTNKKLELHEMLPHYQSCLSSSGENEYYHIECAYIKNTRKRSRVFSRNIFVQLPPDYNENSDNRYPVFYFLDGQNLFSNLLNQEQTQGWYLHKIFPRVIQNQLLSSFILIGIPTLNHARLAELSPWMSRQQSDLKGYGEDLLEHITDDIMPFVNRDYRTLPDPESTGIAGSSMGGVFALWSGFSAPNIFAKVLAMSPSLWFMGTDGQTLFSLIDSPTSSAAKIYLDCGTGGFSRDSAPYTRLYTYELISAGWEVGSNLCFIEATHAEHNEAAWRERIVNAMKFMLKIQ